MNSVFNDPNLSKTATYSDINALLLNAQNETNSSNFNTNLIFGDFINTWNLLKDLLTGGIFSDVFGNGGVMAGSGWGGIDTYFNILLSILFDTSVVFLLIYIVSFRSV